MKRDEAEKLIDRLIRKMQDIDSERRLPSPQGGYMHLCIQRDKIRNDIIAALTGSERPEVDLHKEIMNIPVDANKMQIAVEEASKECTWVRQMEYLYKLAHRDARHAAAEIVTGHWLKVAP
jgi:hypothetical protein